jgi:two-component system chemotaxis sensor kinase CheA
MLLKGKRIFIVEDNVANRSIMQLLLEREGAIVAFERWGRETCERLRAFAPVDIILLDLMFPDGITGFDVFDQIKACGGFSDIPIVAVSAEEPDIAIPEAQTKGFNGFIGKPINRMYFARQIASILNGEKIWGME